MCSDLFQVTMVLCYYRGSSPVSLWGFPAWSAMVLPSSPTHCYSRFLSWLLCDFSQFFVEGGWVHFISSLWSGILFLQMYFLWAARAAFPQPSCLNGALLLAFVFLSRICCLPLSLYKAMSTGHCLCSGPTAVFMGSIARSHLKVCISPGGHQGGSGVWCPFLIPLVQSTQWFVLLVSVCLICWK